MKVAVFTGTRAEYGLLYWLLKDIQDDPELVLQLLVSGMHLSPEFGETYQQIEQDGFFIDEKIEILLSSDSAVGTAKSMGLGVLGFADALNRLKPDVLVILGDRFEALAAAQTAMILRVPILHLHGGEITEGAYDDAIRHAISKLSYLHGTSTEEYRQRVIQLGEQPERVKNVGAIGLDHLKRAEFMDVAEIARSLDFPLNQPYFLVTYHPVTLADEKPEQSFNALLDALDEFKDHQVIITYPNADDGGRRIIPLLEQYAKSNPQRVCAIPSLGQKRYLSTVKNAAVVIGNSSSGIIEVPSFNVPTVNVGVRQQGRLAAKSVLNCDPNK
ncbi:MAG: UDP-N-acetylglucosamine 2-epimerase (hydrolyzing), partial [Pseudoalteromonas sp.]